VLSEVRARIRARRLEAEGSSDRSLVFRLRAMEAVIATGFIPFACPEAISVAGDAAAAACSGVSEPEWFRTALTARAGDPLEQDRLRMAVRLLRVTDLWPWHCDGPQPQLPTTCGATSQRLVP
jgi:hypothetical protein